MKFKFYKDLGDGKTKLFNVEQCETCGQTAMSPNAVGGLVKDRPTYQKLGIAEWIPINLPPETYYDEKTQKTACYGCNGKP
jgi:hypothetical protein